MPFSEIAVTPDGSFGLEPRLTIAADRPRSGGLLHILGVGFGVAVGVGMMIGSGILRSMTEANCILVLDDAQADVAVGDRVHIVLFDGLL